MKQKQGSQNADALGEAIVALLQAPLQIAAALAGTVQERGARGCEIPPPCWEPQIVGTCRLVLTPKGVGIIRVHVSNCGWDQHGVWITALGKLAGWLSFQPTALSLGPQERGTFGVTVNVPGNVKPGESLSGIILVRGCRDWAVRVEIKVQDCAANTCCEVSIDDCPDQIHHWYDHFYCPRPCRTAGKLPTDDVGTVTHG